MKIKVGELTAREEFGRGIVRMDSATMRKLGIREGDIVEIEGTRKTAAIAIRAYPSDIGLNIIRMDGLVRRNAGAGVGEYVKIRKADIKEARSITLAPAQKGVVVRISPNLLKQNIYRRPLTKGDIIIPSPVVKRRRHEGGLFEEFFGMDFEEFFFPVAGETRFVVTNTEPKGIVVVGDITEVEVLPELPKTFELERKVPVVTYEDIGGLHDAIQKVREMIELPLRHPEIFEKVGVEPPKGVLLHGPPGVGKTLLAKAVANESGANFYLISGPEIFSMWYGKTEENLRKIFEEAEKNAPSIIFIDEIDAIAPKREEVRGEVEKRTVSQLLALMDGLKARGKVIVIAATNRPHSLDPALRRPGRFDREIEIGIPDKSARKEILQIHTRRMPLAKDVNLDKIAEITYGFTGADLAALCREAAMATIRRVLPEISLKGEGEIPRGVLEKLVVRKKDFEHALRMVEPSAMREVLIETPNVRWEDIGDLENVKEQLKEVVEWPLKYPESFKRLGIKPPSGILLYGPPGVGKTLLAKAVATESQANFILVKGPELTSMWFGESERRIRELFRRAKQVAPCIIFFDEIEALVPKRGFGIHEASERIVSQLLTEISGVEELRDVVILAATNRPDMLDPALLRPGRFDRQILVPAPDEEGRLKILKVLTKNMPLKNVNLKKIAKETENYSGADLAALCREAAMATLRKNKKAKEITMKEFEKALKKVKPSLSKELIEAYKKFGERFRRGVPEKIEKPEELSYVG